MKNTLPNLNVFPTDNAPSTQLKYDIMAGKFMNGIHNHQRRNAPLSISNDLRLISAILKEFVVLIILLTTGMIYIFTKSSK